MAKKIINYKAKISRSLSNIVRLDPEIITLEPNENAITSNLFKRIQKKKHHYIEMEFDKYSIKSSIISEMMKPGITTAKPYKPKPDIIAHYKRRNSDSIILISEAKKFYFDKNSIDSIVQDYYKIWGYKIATNIDQGILVIYPMGSSGSTAAHKIAHKKSMDVYSESQLRSILRDWDKYEVGAINIIFNEHELNRINTDLLKGKRIYKISGKEKYVLIDEVGESYTIDFEIDDYDGNIEKVVKKIGDTLRETNQGISYSGENYSEVPHEDLVYESPSLRLAKLIKENDFKLLNKDSIKLSHNTFNNNAMLKFYVENEESESLNPIDKNRNLLIIAYTIEYGFVFGMRYISVEDNSDYVKEIPNLKFGYEKGRTWKYFIVKANDIHSAEELFRSLKSINDSTFPKLINYEKISKEINLK